MGVVLFAGWYSPGLCRLHPDKMFVFGDNLRRFGKGGQAIIRDEPNAIGVATKRKPSMSEGSFFAEHSEADLDAVLNDIENVWQFLKDGHEVVIPITPYTREISLGRERAQLPERAPTIYKTICTHVGEMIDSYGERFVRDANGL